MAGASAGDRRRSRGPRSCWAHESIAWSRLTGCRREGSRGSAAGVVERTAQLCACRHWVGEARVQRSVSVAERESPSQHSTERAAAARAALPWAHAAHRRERWRDGVLRHSVPLSRGEGRHNPNSSSTASSEQDVGPSQAAAHSDRAVQAPHHHGPWLRGCVRGSSRPGPRFDELRASPRLPGRAGRAATRCPSVPLAAAAAWWPRTLGGGERGAVQHEQAAHAVHPANLCARCAQTRRGRCWKTPSVRSTTKTPAASALRSSTGARGVCIEPPGSEAAAPPLPTL